MFLGHFWSFLPDGDFFQKIRICQTQLFIAPNIMLIFRKKPMNQSRENLRTNGRMDGQTLFYRTLPVEARVPTNSLQQVTGGNMPNFVLKRMLIYFLKITPLKKILQF